MAAAVAASAERAKTRIVGVQGDTGKVRERSVGFCRAEVMLERAVSSFFNQAQVPTPVNNYPHMGFCSGPSPLGARVSRAVPISKRLAEALQTR